MRIVDMPEFKDKSQVLSFDQNTAVCDAVDSMAQKNYGAIIVTKSGKLAGVFTERDLLRRVAAGRMDLKKTKLKDVMSTDIKTAKEGDKIADSLRRMNQGRFRHLPVLDDKGNVTGMLSQGDFVALTLTDALHLTGITARAEVEKGNSTPFSMIFAIVIYTLGLLFVVSALGFWGTGGP